MVELFKLRWDIYLGYNLFVTEQTSDLFLCAIGGYIKMSPKYKEIKIEDYGGDYGEV